MQINSLWSNILLYLGKRETYGYLIVVALFALSFWNGSDFLGALYHSWAKGALMMIAMDVSLLFIYVGLLAASKETHWVKKGLYILTDIYIIGLIAMTNFFEFQENALMDWMGVGSQLKWIHESVFTTNLIAALYTISIPVLILPILMAIYDITQENPKTEADILRDGVASIIEELSDDGRISVAKIKTKLGIK